MFLLPFLFINKKLLELNNFITRAMQMLKCWSVKYLFLSTFHNCYFKFKSFSWDSVKTINDFLQWLMTIIQMPWYIFFFSSLESNKKYFWEKPDIIGGLEMTTKTRNELGLENCAIIMCNKSNITVSFFPYFKNRWCKGFFGTDNGCD